MKIANAISATTWAVAGGLVALAVAKTWLTEAKRPATERAAHTGGEREMIREAYAIGFETGRATREPGSDPKQDPPPPSS